MVWYTIAGRIYELPFKYKLVVVKNQDSFEEEVARLRHKSASLQAAVDHMQKKETDNERLIGIGEKLDMLKNIFQRPCSLKANALYLHMQVVAPSLKPHNLALVIQIAVVAFLNQHWRRWSKGTNQQRHSTGHAKLKSISQHNKANIKAGA